MTTPEDGPSPPTPSGGAQAKPRIRRPQPQRAGPRRARGPASEPPPAQDPGADPKISDAVSEAVKMGYDVITENIRQGRAAAERFRQGAYNIREAPGDLETAGLRVLQLARELSTTTFDICERLLKELGSMAGAPDRTAEAPPFRPGPTPSPSAPARTPESPPGLKLTTRFVGAAKASARTETLARPKAPTSAADITAEPLAPRTPGAAPITSVTFETDLALEGLIAVVTVPSGQPPGVYAGMVYARGQDIPLGVLAVEIAP